MKTERDNKVPEMRRRKKPLRNNVISARITDDEYLHIARLSMNTGKSVTNILREGLSLWEKHRRSQNLR